MTERPFSASSGGPVLRRIAGVDESLLAEVPTDRFRYSRLGGVIVGTAAIATLSMWFGLGEVAGRTTLPLAAPAMLWGLFIGNLDAWIVSSLHGTRWRQHAWIVLSRVALAIVFGFLIAEPLVLRAFAPAIERDIKDTRQGELLAFQTRLKECNPPDGSLPTSPSCAGAGIVVGINSPHALAQQKDSLHGTARSLEKALAKDNATLEGYETTARLECNGTHGAGLTGKFGVGVNCERDRKQANDFRASSRTGEESAQLLTIRNELRGLTPNLRASTQSYEQAVSAAIATRVAERRASQGRIGLLERLYSLRRLVTKNWYLAIAEWFLRLLFVTIDCLPVIVKVTGGSTAYDHLLEQRRRATEETFSAREKTAVREVTSENELAQYRLERHTQAESERIDSELRLDTARRNLEVDAAIDEFTERLLREQRAGTSARRRRFVDEPSTPTGVASTEI